MPHCLGIDYYAQTILERTTLSNKAVLPIPHTLRKDIESCCHQVPQPADFVLFDLSFGDAHPAHPLEAQKPNAHISGYFSVEPFDNDTFVKQVGNTLLEFVPSSNPESEASPIGSGILCEGEKIGLLSLKEDTLDASANTVSCDFLEEPLGQRHFERAVESLPSPNVLLSRLMAVELIDPLLKSNGRPWQEDDFFEFEVYEQHHRTVKDMKREQFDQIVPDLEKEVETFLSPSIVNGSLSLYEQPVQDLEDFRAEQNRKLLPFQSLDQLTPEKDRHTYPDIKLSEIEDYPDANPPVSSTVPEFQVLHSSKLELSTKCDVNPGLPEVHSPLLDLKLVGVDNHYNLDSLVSQALVELNIIEDTEYYVKSPFTLLSKREEQSCALHIWQRERCFHDILFPEAFIAQEEEWKRVEEILVSLTLELELYDQDVSEDILSLDPSKSDPSTRTPLSAVAVWDSGVEIPTPPAALEVFEKYSRLQMDILKQERPADDEVLDETAKVICMEERSKNSDDTHNVQDVPQHFKPPAGIVDLSPLDSFMHVRSMLHIESNDKKFSTSQRPEVDPKGKLEQHLQEQQVKTAMGAEPLERINNIRTLHVPFSGQLYIPKIKGPFDEMMQCIVSSASLHLDIAKQCGLIQPEKSFFGISVDLIRFLRNEQKQKFTAKSIQSGDDSPDGNIMQNLAVLSVLRTAASLLMDACLESTITYLTSTIDSSNSFLGKSLEELRQQLFRFQYNCQKSDTKHPKLHALNAEVRKCSLQSPGGKILISAQKHLPSLVPAIQQSLSDIPSLTVIRDTPTAEDREMQNITVYITQASHLISEKVVKTFSLVVDYEPSATLKDYCEINKIVYVGIVTQNSYETRTEDNFSLKAKSNPITLICSSEVIQNRELLCMLEARYNISLIERDYMLKSRQMDEFFYADLIVSVDHCVVLLPLHTMGQDWDLDTAGRKFLALGLQFSHCYIITHGMGAAQRYLLDKHTIGNLYKLRSSLTNLSKASENFVTQYKILSALMEEDVASCIRNIVDCSVSTTNHTDYQRPWLSSDATKEESFLVQFVSLNSLSAQMILRKLTLDEIWAKPEEELRSHFPDLPNHVLQVFFHQLSRWKKTQFGSTSSSQTSVCTSMTSEKSCSSCSNSTMDSPPYSPEVNVTLAQESTLAQTPQSGSRMDARKGHHSVIAAKAKRLLQAPIAAMRDRGVTSHTSSKQMRLEADALSDHSLEFELLAQKLCDKNISPYENEPFCLINSKDTLVKSEIEQISTKGSDVNKRWLNLHQNVQASRQSERNDQHVERNYRGNLPIPSDGPTGAYAEKRQGILAPYYYKSNPLEGRNNQMNSGYSECRQVNNELHFNTNEITELNQGQHHQLKMESEKINNDYLTSADHIWDITGRDSNQCSFVSQVGHHEHDIEFEVPRFMNLKQRNDYEAFEMHNNNNIFSHQPAFKMKQFTSGDGGRFSAASQDRISCDRSQGIGALAAEDESGDSMFTLKNFDTFDCNDVKMESNDSLQGYNHYPLTDDSIGETNPFSVLELSEEGTKHHNAPYIPDRRFTFNFDEAQFENSPGPIQEQLDFLRCSSREPPKINKPLLHCSSALSISPTPSTMHNTQFGLFSSRASRTASPLSCESNIHLDSSRDKTNMSPERNLSCSLNVVPSQHLHEPHSRPNSFLRPCLALPPFSVSRHLRKHISNLEKTGNNQVGKFKLVQDDNLSVRVSRPLEVRLKYFDIDSQVNQDKAHDQFQH